MQRHLDICTVLIKFCQFPEFKYHFVSDNLSYEAIYGSAKYQEFKSSGSTETSLICPPPLISNLLHNVYYIHAIWHVEGGVEFKATVLMFCINTLFLFYFKTRSHLKVLFLLSHQSWFQIRGCSKQTKSSSKYKQALFIITSKKWDQFTV